MSPQPPRLSALALPLLCLPLLFSAATTTATLTSCGGCYPTTWATTTVPTCLTTLEYTSPCGSTLEITNGCGVELSFEDNSDPNHPSTTVIAVNETGRYETSHAATSYLLAGSLAGEPITIEIVRSHVIE